MIDPKELRIGNLIRDGIEYSIVWGINEQGIDIGMGFSCSFKHASGIPLTPKILEQCGFKDDINRDAADMILEDFRVFAGHHEWWFWGKGSPVDVGMRINVRLDYLHELQNLYFTLTKKELIYKP